jgi:hypothetical protein
MRPRLPIPYKPFIANTPETSILSGGMKRILLFLGLAAALAVPLGVSAAAGTDGSLSVKKGHATIVLKVRGTVIGRLASGNVRIRDMKPYDNSVPQIRHCRVRYPNFSTIACTGRKIVFRALDGRFVLRLKGSGIFFSAVGRGTVTMLGAGSLTVPNGFWSQDDGPYQPIPDELMTLTLGTPPTRP